MTESLRMIPVRDPLPPEELAEVERRLRVAFPAETEPVPASAASESPANDPLLYVGRVVHFFVSPSRGYILARAALIVEFDPESAKATILVMNPSGMLWKRNVRYGPGTAGCWGYTPWT